jgi:hypothetical protein
MVLEGFAAIDEDHRDLVVELATQFRIAIDVDFLPGEAATARELGKTFLYYLAQMTSLARVNHDLPHELHGWIVAFLEEWIPAGNGANVQKNVVLTQVRLADQFGNGSATTQIIRPR